MKGSEKLLCFAVVFGLASVLLAFPAFSADFTATITPATVNGSLSSRLFNVTVNNIDSADSIIQFRITLPGGFTFVAGSNQTSASNTVFSTSSNNITWTNTTASGFIANGTSEYFVFNSSTPNTTTNYTMYMRVLDTNYAWNVTAKTMTVDASAPNITLNYPGNGTVHGKSTMTFNFTATDAVDGNLTCNLTIDGAVNQSGFGALSGIVTSRTVSGLGGGQHTWKVTCWDNFNHVKASSLYYFQLRSDLTVTYINWSSTPNNRTGAGSDVTFKATVKNSGNFSISKTINISLWWDNTRIETKQNTSQLTKGSSQVITFATITSDSVVTNGLHNVKVFVDSGGAVTEVNETNNNKTLPFLVGYNITIIKINGTSSPYLMANVSFTINVSVKYANGDNVTDLNRTYFNHVYDNTGGGSPERDWGASGYQGTSLTRFTNISSGRYSFRIATYYSPTSPGPGIHNLTVSASKDNYSGSSSGLNYYYLLVPSFSITFGSLMTSINEAYSDAFNIYVTNSGTAYLYNTTATINDNHDYLTFTTCTGSTTVPNNTNTYSVCNPTMTALSVSSTQNGCFGASVGGKSNGLYFNATSIMQCIDVLDTGTAPPTGPPATGGTCTTDANCASGYYCSSGVCKKKTYSLSITSYTASLTVNWSSYTTTKVTVKNDGSTTFTAKLSATITGLETSVMPSSMTLNPGNAIIFTVNISAPSTSTIGNHSGTIRAYVDEDANVYLTKTITVSVLPTPEKESEINGSYYNYSSILSDLKQALERLKTLGFINQSDIDEIESMIEEVDADLGLAKDALDGGDYSTVDSILALMNASLNNIRVKITGLEAEQSPGIELSGVWLWVVIAVVVIIVVGFMVYLFMPSLKGQRYGAYGYRPMIKEGFLEKLGEAFRRGKKIKPKSAERPVGFRPAYREGYEKLSSSSEYRGGKGTEIKEKFSGIKKIFKRKKKQKEVSDFFSE